MLYLKMLKMSKQPIPEVCTGGGNNSVKGEFITSPHGQRTAARGQRLQNISEPNSLTEEFHFADLLDDAAEHAACFWSVSGCQKASRQHSFVKLNSVNTEPLSFHQRVHSRDCGGLPAPLAVKHSSVTLFEGPACRQRNQAGLTNLLLQRVTPCLQTGGVWLHQLLRFSIIIHRVYCPLKHFIAYQN